MRMGADQTYSFAWPDIAVFTLVIGVSLGIGLFQAVAGPRKYSRSEYFHGNRMLSWTPVGLSLLMTFQSAIMILGVPAEIYSYGMGFVIFNISKALAVLIVAFYFVPLLYPLKLTSTFEYLERRYKSKLPRVVGSLLGHTSMILFMGIAIFTPSVAMATASGIPVWVMIVLTGAVGTMYTTLGGMKAVIWTDVFQFIIMAGGLIAIIVKGSIAAGGMKNIWEISEEGGRTQFNNFDFDPRTRHTVWSLIIGGTLSWLCNIGVTQSSVQRFSSVPTFRASQLTLLISLPGFVMFGAMSTLLGITMYAHFTLKGCDPLSNGIISNQNQLVPQFVMDIFESVPGFSGLFVSSLCAASLSTISSSLNGLSAMTWEDMLSLKLSGMKEKHISYIIKTLVIIYGIIAVLMALMTMQMKGPATQIALGFLGAAGGPLMGMYLLGSTIPWANSIGASVGAIISAIFCLWISLGRFSVPKSPPLPPAPGNSCFLVQNSDDPLLSLTYTTMPASLDVTSSYREEDSESAFKSLYQISYLWYSAIGILGTIIIGLLVSLCTGRMNPDSIEPGLLLPVRHLFCGLLPASAKCKSCCLTSTTEHHPMKNGDIQFTYIDPENKIDNSDV